ncbi:MULTISPECIES: hypothetical protein [unclassified Streptomyces]|uniref:hypothetical protein n=1 Tax=unclassified Streptomyces TaxID=2593676 RepID=UPI00081EF18A|nr:MULTISPECIES: hypothetical protein [unclassified Streptomyces]MYZ39960.1 hypothetical protein [Streptomyces sp. SID4917]SCG05998.1 hypothetical protein GA0115259_110002 [Streptomyces sp. MnatMP-M17]
MARTEMDRQIEEGVEQAAVFVGRFVSGAPMGEQPRAPGGIPRGVHALLRLAVVAWAGWGAWMWWGLHEHQRVVGAAVITACVAAPLAVILTLRGRTRRRHMRSLVLPMALAMKDMLPAWDDHQRLRALTIPLDRSFVKIRLPDGWHGQDGHKDMLRELVQDRMGGRWSGEWNLKSYPFSVVFTPQKPRPKLEPPETVDFFDTAVQQAIAQCKPGQLVLGIDERHKPVFKSMTGETAMWALSVGSGGGKSSFLQMIITQLVGQGATVVGIDVKMASIICFEGVPGVHLYTDPGNVGDMRSAIKWVAREVEARNYVKKKDPGKNFDRLTLILEEGNEFGDASKAYWNDTKEKGDPASDPIWGDIASVMRMGRHVNVTIIGVFQDLREAAVGSRGLRNMFRLILMGNYNANQWKMIVNTTPVPESIDRAGRMMIIEGNRRIWIQVPYADPDAFREHSLKLRRERGYSTEDLYGTPPSASPQRLPSLLQESTPLLTKEAAPALEAADFGDGGGVVTLVKDEEAEPGDTEFDEDLDELADNEYEGEPAAELLALAEISRRLAEEGIEVSAELMRQHKRRRADFPAGEAVDGKDLFTYEAVAGYYRPDTAD